MTPASILNVEDYPAARYAKTRVLVNAGFNVREANSGAEALAAIAHEYPDLVLLDVRLPDMDGRELCRKLKANPNTAELRVIHTSAAYITNDDILSGYESGADAYLCAPYEPSTLIRLVHSLTG